MRASFISPSDTQRQAETMRHKQEKEKGGNQPECGHVSLLNFIAQDAILIHLFNFIVIKIQKGIFLMEKTIYILGEIRTCVSYFQAYIG